MRHLHKVEHDAPWNVLMGILKGEKLLLLTESGIWDSCMAERWQLKWVREFTLNLDVQTWTGKKIKALQITTLHYIFYLKNYREAAATVPGVCKQTRAAGVLFCFLIWMGYFVFKENLWEKMKRWKRTYRIIKLPSSKVGKKKLIFHYFVSSPTQ